MKIIFSRKGFDAQYSGQPSPILPAKKNNSLYVARNTFSE